MINKDNYEAYFLDFIEGNISEKDREDLERFLKENPCLTNELDSYDKDLVLTPDETITYNDKTKLKKYIIHRPNWAVYSSVASIFVLFIVFSMIIHNDKSTPTINNSSLVQDRGVIERAIKEIQTIAKKNIPEKEKAEGMGTEKKVNILDTCKRDINPKNIIINSNSLIVYEVDNLIEYKKSDSKDIKAERIIEVDNLIVYKDTPENNYNIHPILRNKYVNQIKNKIENKFEKRLNDFNNSIAYLQENVKIDDSGINLCIKK